MAAKEIPWGTVPAPLVRLMALLRRKVVDAGIAWRDHIPGERNQPRDHSEDLTELAREAQAAQIAAMDMRSLVSAYAHRFHNPRPALNKIAEAQGTIPQGLVRRYNDKTVAAIESLLSAEPNVDVIRRGFRSLTSDEVEELLGPGGVALVVEGVDEILRSATERDASR